MQSSFLPWIHRQTDEVFTMWFDSSYNFVDHIQREDFVIVAITLVTLFFLSSWGFDTILKNQFKWLIEKHSAFYYIHIIHIWCSSI